MKPTFHAHPVNGPFEDPCVYIDIFREGRAVLFDLGDIRRIPPGKLLRVTDVFITHMHIDHFIGFDALLRTLLRTERPLRLYGPEGLLRCLQGKLAGYTWNLIRDYPLRIEAHEVGNGGIVEACFNAGNAFAREDIGSRPFDGTVRSESLFIVRCALLSHDIPVLAYSLQEENHLNINKDLLNARGLPVGQWLARLKDAIRSGAPETLPIAVEGRQYPLSHLADLVTVTKGQKITYVMDASPTAANREKMISIAHDSDILFCEAFFIEEDSERAKERHHLTAGFAAGVARDAGVRTLVLLHFSPRYRDREAELYREAAAVFGGAVIVSRQSRMNP